MSTQKDNIPRGVALLHDPLRNKGTAFTEVERDARAGQRPLKRPEHKIAIFFNVETDPEKTERLLEHCRDICQVRNYIGLATNQCFDLWCDLSIDRCSIRVLSKLERFGHKA